MCTGSVVLVAEERDRGKGGEERIQAEQLQKLMILAAMLQK